jgi:hypothetical protein
MRTESIALFSDIPASDALRINAHDIQSDGCWQFRAEEIVTLYKLSEQERLGNVNVIFQRHYIATPISEDIHGRRKATSCQKIDGQTKSSLVLDEHKKSAKEYS